MKRVYFALFFLAVSLLFLYSQPQILLASPDTMQCFSDSNSGFVSSTESIKDLPVNYNYEEQQTKDWKISANRGNYAVLVNDLDSNNALIQLPLSVTRSSSTANCEYYSFTFQRQAKTLIYDLPRKNIEPRTSEGKQICEYSVTPIQNDLQKILALGGRALEISNVCPDAREKELAPDINECPPFQACSVSITSGSLENYGFSVEKDQCGNKIIEPDNSGSPIPQDELQAKAQSFVSNCLSGSKSRTRMQVRVNPVPAQGSGSQSSQQADSQSSTPSSITNLIGCTNPFLPECKNGKDDDGDYFVDCTRNNEDSGCFVCDWQTNTAKCDPDDNSEKTCPLLSSPEKTLRCGDQCCDPETEMCIGGEVIDNVPFPLVCSIGCQPLTCALEIDEAKCREILHQCAAENSLSNLADDQGKIKLPGFKMRVTKTTYKDSCDPTGTTDAGSIIEVTYDRWINLDCKNPQLSGKATIDFVYFNDFWFVVNMPSLEEVRQKLFESIRESVKDFLSPEDIEKIRQLIYSEFTPPQDQQEGQNKIITIEIIDGKYYITINGKSTEPKGLTLRNSASSLTVPPSLEKLKDITDANGNEKIRSIRIEVFDENGNKIADSCFNNLKLADNKNRDAILRQIDEFYKLNIKSYFDKLKTFLDCVKEKSCVAP